MPLLPIRLMAGLAILKHTFDYFPSTVSLLQESLHVAVSTWAMSPPTHAG